MKIKKYIPLIILALVLILELLPYGAVCNFARPATDGTIGHFRELYSYFDLLPFGYANFGPFMTALLTCFMFPFSILHLFKPNRKILSIWKWLCVFSVATSLGPILLGLHFYSVVGGTITLLLILEYFFLKTKP